MNAHLTIGAILCLACLGSAVVDTAAASPSLVCESDTVSTGETTLAAEGCYLVPHDVDDPFEVTLNVTNQGSETGTHTFDLLVNGTVVDAATVTVQPGESREVALTTNFSTVGAYDVSVPGVVTDDLLVQEDVGLQPAFPTDPDGDGRYEDANGDERVDVLDVQYLFASLDAPTVRDNPATYDFNGDGTVDVLDVQALFAEMG